MDVSASPLWMRYSPGAQKLLRMCNESSFRHPCEADSNMGNCSISRCKCIDTSPRSSSGNSLSVWNKNCLNLKERIFVTVYNHHMLRMNLNFTFWFRFKVSQTNYSFSMYTKQKENTLCMVNTKQGGKVLQILFRSISCCWTSLEHFGSLIFQLSLGTNTYF